MPTLEAIVSPVLIGRGREMELLDQALAAAHNGEGRCLLLAGEAGIGKSRLLDELRSRAQAAHFTILQGSCFEQDVSFPYAPWIDALRAWLAPQSHDEIRESLGPLAPELFKLLPELTAALPDLSAIPALDAEAEKRRLFDAIARLAARLAQSSSLLLAIEDLHWADDTSLAVFHSLARRIARYPILLIGTYRQDEPPPALAHFLPQMNRERLAREITLVPFRREEVAEMVQAIFALSRPIKSDFLDVITPFAEGNPYYVEEILKSLVGTGDIYFIEGQWERKAAEDLHLPSGLREAVLQRTEPLAPETRKLLTLAAVAGQRFDFALLKQLTELEDAELLVQLKQLVAAHLLVEVSADEFAFRHSLTRAAIYDTLLARERWPLHRRIAEAMERLYADPAARAAHVPELAFHFYRAAVWDKALEYSQRAGEQAQSLYAPRQALTHLSRALLAAERQGVTPPSSILRSRAHAHELLGEFDLARVDYEAALDSVRRVGDRQAEWQSLIDLGFLWQSRDWVRAGDYFEHAFDLARSLDAPSLTAHTLNRLGNWRSNRGRPREALSDHQQALALFREVNDRRGMAQTLDLLCFDGYVLANPIQGAAYGEQAVPILRELNERQALVNTLANLSLRPRFDTEVLGEFDLHQLAAQSESAAEVARSCDYRKGEADALSKAAACLFRAGEFGRGLELLGRAEQIAQEIEHRELDTTLHFTWGIEYYTGLLAAAQAREHLELALVGAQEAGGIALAFIATARLVSACILQNDLSHAQALLDTLLTTSLPDAAEMTFMVRGCRAAQAELDLARGDPEHALETVERLLASTANLAHYGPHSVPRLSLLRGQALAALGRTKAAIEEFQGALVVTRKQNQLTMLWRLHAELGQAYRSIGRRDEAEQQFSSARSLIRQIADTVPDSALREHFAGQAMAFIPAPPILTPRRAAMKEFGGLTEREREIAVLVAQGKSNREIAEKLVLTVRTVEAHITHILEKLGLKSRAEIAVWAVGKGLVNPPP